MAALDWLQNLLGGGQYGDPSTPAMPTQPLPDDALTRLRDSLGQGAASSLYAGGGDVQPGLNMLGHAAVAPALAGGAALEATMTGQPVSAAEMLQAAMMGITPTPTRLPGGVPSATPTTMERLWADEQGGIRAYHGSPHSFDRFDLSKIGTGEGAQAYGHGLYFAENEGVARGYRETLAGRPYKQLNPWDATKENTPLASYTRQSLADYGNDPTATLAVLRAAGDERSLAAADLISKQLSKVREVTPGHMYEVDINADPKSFLDWDKPLEAQAENLQSALSVPRGQMPTGAQVSELMRLARERGVNYKDLPEYAALEKQYQGATAVPELGPNIGPNETGAALYEKLRQSLGDAPQASKALRLSGIPGIRYLDQGSRGLPETNYYTAFRTPGGGVTRSLPYPDEAAAKAALERLRARGYKDVSLTSEPAPRSSNYVMFDPSLVEILRKYGIIPPLAGGGLLATQGPDDQ